MIMILLDLTWKLSRERKWEVFAVLFNSLFYGALHYDSASEIYSK